MLSLLKMWWMFFWRIYVALFLVTQSSDAVIQAAFAALVAAAVLRFGIGVSLKTWPVFRFIFRKTVVNFESFSIRGLFSNFTFSSPITRKQYYRPTYSPKIDSSSNKSSSSLPEASKSNPYEQPEAAKVEYVAPAIDHSKTAANIAPQTPLVEIKDYVIYNEEYYSPMTLDDFDIPGSFMMNGSPGAGLSESNFSETNIRLGQKGEVNFAKSLSYIQASNDERMIDRLHSFWSVSMPDKNIHGVPDSNLKTDIDCILVNNSFIYLIDLKYYKSNGVRYNSFESNLNSWEPGVDSLIKSTPMTRNMEIALERFTKLYPSFNVQARVVFVPTSEMSACLNTVFWPGGVPALNLSVALTELSKLEISSLYYDSPIVKDLTALLK